MQGLCRPVSVWPCAVVHATSSSSGSFGAVVLGLLAGLGAFKLRSSISVSHIGLLTSVKTWHSPVP
jgi:hypothetical protein